MIEWLLGYCKDQTIVQRVRERRVGSGDSRRLGRRGRQVYLTQAEILSYDSMNGGFTASRSSLNRKTKKSRTR